MTSSNVKPVDGVTDYDGAAGERVCTPPMQWAYLLPAGIDRAVDKASSIAPALASAPFLGASRTR
jgi:hypothetical protein